MPRPARQLQPTLSLRVGEYTLPPEHRTTRTVQFCICDIHFWQGQTLLPPNSDSAILAAASSVTLIMDTKKDWATWRHHPPGSGARRFLPSPLYSRARECHYGARHVINNACEFCTTGDSCTTQPYSLCRPARSNTKLNDSGYTLSRIGTHSLRASGAIAFWLSGHGPVAIMKLGCWRTQTFLTYIHAQIAELTSGTSHFIM